MVQIHRLNDLLRASLSYKTNTYDSTIKSYYILMASESLETKLRMKDEHKHIVVIDEFI